jgi:arabinogalactan endo-1,4-beta-galactosidase
MASKAAEKLLQQAQAKAPQRKSEKEAEGLRTKKIAYKTYEVVAVSLYSNQSEWLNQTADALQKVNRRYNRSSIVQEALERLQEDFRGLKPEKMDEDIHDRQRKRSRAL